MRFRFINQISKFRLSGGQSSSLGTRHPANQTSHISSSLRATWNQTPQPNKGKVVALQRRLLSGNVIQTARAALVVEGCSTILLTWEGIPVPNMPRGWDAGVDDDDGG